MACTLGNKCAKNLCKRVVLLQLIIKNVVTCFFWNTVYIKIIDNNTKHQKILEPAQLMGLGQLSQPL